MKPEAIMIFGAGLGTRMGALTRDRPKPLIEVAGEPLIGHALALARDAGIGRIVVNVHAHAPMMRDWLASHAPDVLISPEPDLLETGGGLKLALPLLGEGPVLTLNSDMVWDGRNPLARLIGNWDAERMDGLLCLVPRADAVGHAGAGDFELAADGLIVRRGAGFVYAGAGIIQPRPLDGFEGKFSLNPVWDGMLATERLHGVVHEGPWVDVGRPEGIALAEAALAE